MSLPEGIRDNPELYGRCGTKVAGGACGAEGFLHWLVAVDSKNDGVTMVCCTDHVGDVELFRPCVYHDTVQVHEVTDVCALPDALWDVRINRCVLVDGEPASELSAEEKIPSVVDRIRAYS